MWVDMAKTDLLDQIDANEQQLVSLAQQIWETPELALHEESSAAALIEYLDEANFTIETDVGGMSTAFVATYGEGDPQVGILGEYDALPGLSQEVAAEPKPVEENAPGHGCGHNLFGTAGVGAAVAVKDVIDAGDVDGTIIFYGCPAEETLVGKTYMARAGVFDDLDAALTWHPGDLSTPRMGSSNALNSLTFTFEGVSTHAAGAPESGRSALDAVELLNTGVEYMREHLSDDARIHYAITDGGQAPNVVPATASVWYFVRAPTRSEVETNTEWLRDIADAAAKMTQTSVEERFLTGCYDYQANETLTDVIWANMEDVGPINYTDDERAFASELQSTVSNETRKSRLADVPETTRAEIGSQALYAEPIEAFDANKQNHGSTDVADVSWITPTAQFRAATWPVGTPGHSWQAVAANGDFGQNGVTFAAKVLGGAVYDLMSDPSIIQNAHEKFESMLDGRSYETPLAEQSTPPTTVVQR